MFYGQELVMSGEKLRVVLVCVVALPKVRWIRRREARVVDEPIFVSCCEVVGYETVLRSIVLEPRHAWTIEQVVPDECTCHVDDRCDDSNASCEGR